MLDERKAAILRVVVEKYIETAQPVGSGHVATAPGVTVSPATVRSEMAALEQEGFLVQPHTSAGRIPTDKGYRFFVDSLGRGRLSPDAVLQVGVFFAKAHGALEQMLHDTSLLLSKLTNYAAVVVPPMAETATVRSVQVVGLGRGQALVVVVLSSGAVLNNRFTISEEIGEEVLGAATARLFSGLAGRTLAAVATQVTRQHERQHDAANDVAHDLAHEAVAAPSGDPAIDEVIAGALDALRGEAHDDDQVYVGGAARVVTAFEAVETVRQVLVTLEQQFVLVTLMRDLLDRGLSIAIGHEHGVEPLASCSVVVAPYLVEGEPVGTIGVLGPTRMNYPQALAAVEVVSERLGRRLSTG